MFVQKREEHVADTLDRIIYGKPENGLLEVLALTGDLTAEEAAEWLQPDLIDPVSLGDTSLAFGIFNGAGRRFILVRTEMAAVPLYEYVLLPRRVLAQLAGNLEPLLAFTRQTLPPVQPSSLLAPLELPALEAWPQAERQQALAALLDDYAGGDPQRVLTLLDAALDERLLLVNDYAGDAYARAAWVQGLMALLPPAARPELTFATHTHLPTTSTARIIFTDTPGPSRRWASSGDLPADFRSPYVQQLAAMWGDNLLDQLAEVEPLAVPGGTDLDDVLAQFTTQLQLFQRINAGEQVPDGQLKAIFSSEMQLPPALHLRLAEQLLLHTLENRDTEAALIIALQMDANPALDEALGRLLLGAVETHPDSVYVFVRTRLNDAMEASANWIRRLQIAALHSLRVAITAADGTTIINWLRLIAREPAAYGLGEILRQGIFTAQARAHDDGELARQLLVLAVKRDPGALDHLLNDPLLLAAVPDNLGRVLRDYEGDALFTLQNRGPELFLVVMARAARAQAPALFNTETIDHIWRLYIAGQHFNLPPHYQPQTIVQAWASTGGDWLPPDLIQHIGTLLLADGRDEMFYQWAANLARDERLRGPLPDILHNSQRNVTDIISIVNQLIAIGSLDPQTAVETDIALLNTREWRQNAMPLVEQIARMVQQHPALDIPAETIWRLLDMAAASRSDAVARVATRQLFNDMEARFREAEADPETITFAVDTLLRLFEQLQWSSATRQSVLNWWRELVRSQPLAPLSRLDKAMEGKRLLEDVRTILQSTLAFRRMLGKRTLVEFARDINIAFSVLEALADSFDPSPRRPAKLDTEALRAEMDTQQASLSDQQRSILATNFRELAFLISEMADHRSKANLMRRGENIDRLLMSGEQQPDSAVDLMKWMAGYLDGSQSRSEDVER